MSSSCRSSCTPTRDFYLVAVMVPLVHRSFCALSHIRHPGAPLLWIPWPPLQIEKFHQNNHMEQPGGDISIHIVPAGVNQSIHPYDWYPTLSFFRAPHTKTVGLHGRNMRPNSEGASGSRGDYKLAQVDQQLVEKVLMRFISAIANW